MRFGTQLRSCRLPVPSLQLSRCDATSTAQRIVSRYSQKSILLDNLRDFIRFHAASSGATKVFDIDIELHYLYNVLTIYYLKFNLNFKKAAVSGYCRFNNDYEKNAFM